MSGPAVAVVIPSWNSLALPARAASSSLRDQGVDVELLVVDNGSTDGSLDYLEREGVPHVALPQNIGFAAAVNLGAARTSAPAILVLNADTVLEPGCVGAPARGARAPIPSLGGVQPRILQLEGAAGRRRLGRLRPPLQRRPGADPRRAGVRAGDGGGAAARAPARREVFGVCGAACLLRRELFDRARRLRRVLLRLLRGRRPQRAGADRRLALRVRARGGRLARRQRLLERGLRAAGGRERAARRAQPARHPGQVHAGERRAADRRGRGRLAAARRARSAASAPPAAASSPPCAGSRRLLRERRRLRRERRPPRARRWLGGRAKRSYDASGRRSSQRERLAGRDVEQLRSPCRAARGRRRRASPAAARRAPAPVRSPSSWPAQIAASQASARSARPRPRHHAVAAQHVAAAPAGAGVLLAAAGAEAGRVGVQRRAPRAPGGSGRPRRADEAPGRGPRSRGRCARRSRRRRRRRRAGRGRRRRSARADRQRLARRLERLAMQVVEAHQGAVGDHAGRVDQVRRRFLDEHPGDHSRPVRSGVQQRLDEARLALGVVVEQDHRVGRVLARRRG